MRSERGDERRPARASEAWRGDAPRERVSRFFAEQLPRAIAKRADRFDPVSGTLAVIVEGAGAWTVRFGDHRRGDAVVPGGHFDATCVAVFSVAAFVDLLEGRSSRPPVVLGDARLLSRFGQLLLEPARGALGAQLGATRACAGR